MAAALIVCGAVCVTITSLANGAVQIFMGQEVEWCSGSQPTQRGPGEDWCLHQKLLMVLLHQQTIAASLLAC